MALIKCPECGSSISDKAEMCSHCGLPASYFLSAQAETVSPNDKGIDYNNIGNFLLSFDRDHAMLFAADQYISHRDEEWLRSTYETYYCELKNKLIFQYVCNNASAFRVDIDALKRFLSKMHTLSSDITTHNTNYVNHTLVREKTYFDDILKDIDPDIILDEEQRRAVITDDDYCLLVAGAGAGKTTTMAAKVKYLVERKRIDPQEIIVISYTNKAIGELQERINKGLGIPAKICTFHSFAFDIVKQFSAQPPEINFSSYQIIFDMLEKAIFNNKPLMRNLVLFLGYYFDLSEDVFQFDDLNQYHLYKAAQDFETLKSGLGEYIRKVEQQRSRKTRTITGEYLRSIQEVQIANFLYLNGLDYEYERVYPFGSPSRNKKYTPDFCITQGEHTVWLEHYALSESGYSVRWICLAEGELHAVDLWMKSQKNRGRKITAAVYEYLADCGGKWGELSYNFKDDTAEILLLAEWDTITNHRFAMRAIEYLWTHQNDFLPEQIVLTFWGPDHMIYKI